MVESCTSNSCVSNWYSALYFLRCSANAFQASCSCSIVKGLFSTCLSGSTVFSSVVDAVFSMAFNAGILGVLFCFESRLVPFPFSFGSLGSCGIFGVDWVTGSVASTVSCGATGSSLIFFLLPLAEEVRQHPIRIAHGPFSSAPVHQKAAGFYCFCN